MGHPSPIVDTKLGDDAKFMPDILFNERALAATGDIDSNEFELGNVMGRNQVEITAHAAGTLGSAVTVTVLTSALKGGTKDNVEHSFTISSGAVTAGQILFKWIPPRETKNIWTIVRLTTTADESANKVNGAIRYVS